MSNSRIYDKITKSIQNLIKNQKARTWNLGVYRTTSVLNLCEYHFVNGPLVHTRVIWHVGAIQVHFTSCLLPLFQNESCCEHVSKTHFHMKGLCTRTRFKAEAKGTRKWPIKNKEPIRFEKRCYCIHFTTCIGLDQKKFCKLGRLPKATVMKINNWIMK